jgi:SAM-dependent methyltransferase
VLDVGTGTGIVALEAAGRVGPSGRVVGIDLSEAMLQVAKAKAERAGFAHTLDLGRMDAERLALSAEAFDAVISLFALFHFPSPLTALRQMYRVLRNGGRLVVAVGSGAPLLSRHGLLHRARRLGEIWQEIRGRRLTAPRLLEKVVERRLPNAERPEVPAWVRGGQGRAAVIRLLREAGFTKLRTSWLGHQEVFDSPEEFWELQRTFSSVARKRLAGVSATLLESLRAEFIDSCRRVQARGGVLAYRSGAFFVAAERPLR